MNKHNIPKGWRRLRMGEKIPKGYKLIDSYSGSSSREWVNGSPDRWNYRNPFDGRIRIVKK